MRLPRNLIITTTVFLLCSVSVFKLHAQRSAGLKGLNSSGLLVDLNADHGIVTSENNKIESWRNSVAGSPIQVFERRDEGRKIAGSGRPALKEKLKEINSHNSVQFYKQELLNKDESACDTLITGSGFTWIAVLRPYTQVGLLKDVNSFFGNLRNGGKFEGFWAGFTDDNRLWTGGRNGISFGRWDHNNPHIVTPEALDTTHYYILAGRMEAGTDTALIELFVNNLSIPQASGPFPINPEANSSMLAIGQERDAIEHPGIESFNGEITRFLIFGRPLTNREMKRIEKGLARYYGISNR